MPIRYIGSLIPRIDLWGGLLHLPLKAGVSPLIVPVTIHAFLLVNYRQHSPHQEGQKPNIFQTNVTASPGITPP